MEETLHTSGDIASEIRTMVTQPAFTGQKGEFSGVTDALVAEGGTTGERAWAMVTEKIVRILPDYITEGLIFCSLEKVGEQEVCRDAVRKKQTILKITPGKNFPAVKFRTFYPYLDFIIRAGPIDLLHLKTKFRVEGTMAIRDAVIGFEEGRIKGIRGTVSVSMTISLCKGRYPVLLHKIEKPVTVT